MMDVKHYSRSCNPTVTSCQRMRHLRRARLDGPAKERLSNRTRPLNYCYERSKHRSGGRLNSIPNLILTAKQKVCHIGTVGGWRICKLLCRKRKVIRRLLHSGLKLWSSQIRAVFEAIFYANTYANTHAVNNSGGLVNRSTMLVNNSGGFMNKSTM